MEYRKFFEYDLWANKLWLPVAESLGETHVLAHVLTASQIWLARCKHEEADLRDDLPLDVRFQEVSAAWIAFLETAHPSTEVSYTNSRGESFTNTVGDIVRHVINHGTYHRGHLRGVASERRIEFPETDYILFARG